VKLAYLPAYSPDLNPIEEGFSAMKAWIRRYPQAVRQALNSDRPARAHSILRKAVYESMTAENAAGWYKHSGYLE
jgi:hypothetical protein